MQNTAEIPADSATGALVADLQALGVRTSWAAAGSGRAMAFTARVSVSDVVLDAAAADALFSVLAACRRRGASVSLSVSDFGACDSVTDTWQAFCERLRPAGISPGFLIHSHQMPLEAFCMIADAVLGEGPRYVYCDSLQMLPHSNPGVAARSDANWRFAWRQRHSSRRLSPVYGGFVRSACPLLSDEVADSVLADSGLHVPRGSAWSAAAIYLPDFADAAGRLDQEQLRDSVRRALPLLDSLHDIHFAATRAQAVDARDNRRIALELTGLGDLVVRQNADPQDLRCLKRLSAAIDRVRNVLRRQSAKLAGTRGAAPALEQACPSGEWLKGPHGASWSQQFDNARRASATRHRNLLVMSPYAVLPGGAHCKPAFTDLLPLIGYADAWRFSDGPGFEAWNRSRFTDFHRRARAVIQASHTATRVAAGV